MGLFTKTKKPQPKKTTTINPSSQVEGNVRKPKDYGYEPKNPITFRPIGPDDAETAAALREFRIIYCLTYKALLDEISEDTELDFDITEWEKISGYFAKILCNGKFSQEIGARLIKRDYDFKLDAWDSTIKGFTWEVQDKEGFIYRDLISINPVYQMSGNLADPDLNNWVNYYKNTILPELIRLGLETEKGATIRLSENILDPDAAPSDKRYLFGGSKILLHDCDYYLEDWAENIYRGAFLSVGYDKNTDATYTFRCGKWRFTAETLAFSLWEAASKLKPGDSIRNGGFRVCSCYIKCLPQEDVGIINNARIIEIEIPRCSYKKIHVTMSSDWKSFLPAAQEIAKWCVRDILIYPDGKEELISMDSLEREREKDIKYVYALEEEKEQYAVILDL